MSLTRCSAVPLVCCRLPWCADVAFLQTPPTHRSSLEDELKSTITFPKRNRVDFLMFVRPEE
jgi:hypothetical protein